MWTNLNVLSLFTNFFFTLPWFILQYFVPKLRLCKVQFVLDYYLECLQLFKYNLLNYFETKWCVELKKVQHSNCCHVLVSLQTALTAEDGTFSFVQGTWCSNRSHWFYNPSTKEQLSWNQHPAFLSRWKPPAEYRQSWEQKCEAMLLWIKPTQNFSYSLGRQRFSYQIKKHFQTTK